MCVIIQGKFNRIKNDIIEKSFTRNPHGFGLMFLDKKNNLVTKKFYTKRINKIKKELKLIEKDLNKSKSIGLHFRYNTAGLTNNFNSHPFKILDKSKGDKFDLALMHNSPTITTLEIEKNKSDTYHFCEYYLKPILKNNPDLILNESFISDLTAIINTHIDSRVLILENKTNSFHLLGDWKQARKLNVSNNLLDEYKFTKWQNQKYKFDDDSLGLDIRPKLTTYEDMISFNENKILNDDLKPYAQNKK